DRVLLAHEHVTALEPLLSRLTIDVTPEAATDGLRVTLDGAPIARAAWGTTVVVDPGAHVIIASAPSRKTREVRIAIGARGDTRSIAVTSLDPIDDPAIPKPAPPIDRAP